MDYHILKRRSIARLGRIEKYLKESLRMMRAWNEIRTEEEPFDIGWEVVLLGLVKDELQAWQDDDLERATLIGKRMVELARNAVV